MYKTLINLGLIAGWIAAGLLTAPALFADQPEFTHMSPQTAAQRSDLVIIDVREAYELAEELGYIDGALNIPVGLILAEGLGGKIDRNSPILMVCRTGVRSARAAARAKELGFDQVYSLDGGMTAWVAAGLEVKRAKGGGHSRTLPDANNYGIPCS